MRGGSPSSVARRLVAAPKLWCFLSDQATSGPPKGPTTSGGGQPTSFRVRMRELGEYQSSVSIPRGCYGDSYEERRLGKRRYLPEATGLGSHRVSVGHFLWPKLPKPPQGTGLDSHGEWGKTR